jgi:SET domain-containing protein
MGIKLLRRCGVPAVKIAAQVSPFELTVRRSSIEGRGVFAGVSIPRGRKVIAYAGEKITRAEAARRVRKSFRETKELRTYFASIARKRVPDKRHWFLDGSVGGNGSERINHCCDPNLFVRKAHGKIYFYSLRGIRKGEELSFDYAFAEERIRIPCRCGSKKCRGFMNRRLAEAFRQKS